MSSELQNRVQVKLFIGFPITSEVRMHLKESREWELARTKADLREEDLVEEHFQNKSYLGVFATSQELEIQEVTKVEKNIRQEFQRYCPTLNIDKFDICVFPQVLIK